jgi:hypothetical protein
VKVRILMNLLIKIIWVNFKKYKIVKIIIIILFIVLKDENIPFERDRTLVRGLDYYNGTCFEIKYINNN